MFNGGFKKPYAKFYIIGNTEQYLIVMCCPWLGRGGFLAGSVVFSSTYQFQVLASIPHESLAEQVSKPAGIGMSPPTLQPQKAKGLESDVALESKCKLN